MKISYVAGDPIPSSLGRCADELKKVKDLATAMQKEVDVVRKRASELQEHLISSLGSEEYDTGAAGKTYRAQLKISEKPTVEDWEQFYDYVVDEDRFDLLQKRLSDKAIMDTLVDGTIPGINTILLKSISLTKL